MAYPVGKATVQHSNNSTTVVVTLPSHQDGDLLVLFLSQDGGGTNITESGTSAWTVVQPGSVTGAARMTLAYRYVTSGAPVANPTFTGTAAEAWSVQKIVIRDADPTTYVAGTASATFTTNPAASPALSTVDADDAYGPILLLYAWCFDGTAMYCRALSNDLVELGKDMGDPQAVTDQTIASICGYRLQASYGAAPSLNAYAISTTEGGNSWVVAIKNKSGGVIAEDCRTGLIEGTAATTGVNWYGDFGAAHKAVTWVKPSDFISGTINGIATYTVAADSADVTTATRGAIAPWASYTVIRENDNLTTTFAGAAAWTGRGHTCSATDMSGKVFFVQWYASGSFATFLGSDGIIVAFKDGGGDWVSYQLRPKENIYNLEEVSSAIALGNATIYAASDGTGAAMDWTDVQGIGYFMHRLPGSTAIFDMAFKNACLMDSAVITGGSASIPASFTTLTSTLNSWGLGSTPIWGNHSPTSLQGAAQVLAKASVQIGDGTTPTYFDATAKAFTYPLTYSATSQPLWNVNANRATLNIKPSASDTINLTATGITTTNAQYLTIDAAASTSAAHAETGASIVGPWDVTWLTGYDCIGATFSGCDEINFKGADVTNCTITDTVSTDAAAAWDTSGATVDSCTIDGTGALYALELGASVTAITLTDCAITAGSTNKVHVLATTGTVTITISGSTSLSLLEVDDEGATVVISAPLLYQKVTVSGITTGARVQIYDTTSSTELFNGTATAGDTVVTGSTVVWTDPLAASANRAIRVRVSYVSGATAKNFIETSGLTCGQTSGTAEITYPVSPTDDTVYNANAITGSGVTGVTFTDAATDVVNINVVANAISWKTIYAAWVYYVFGATGIASDIDYIDAVDEANYILSNMIIKNTSSPTAPLEVTGGYGRDSVTGATIDLADTTGGTLIFAPDHVVSYAVGSGVTAQDITDIAAASGTAAATATLAAAQTTPIHSDVRKVVGITVDGTGTDIDPWGPA